MKIRTDFVTNSSSSSFILSIRFDLKDDSEVVFNAEGGTGETGRVDYFDFDAKVKVSPKELATAPTVDEMINRLTNGVVDDCIWEEEEIKIFEKSNPCVSDVDGQTYDAYDFVEEIREKIKSMDDIASVYISGNEYNYMDYCREYTYNRETGEYYGFVEGYDFEKDGSSGGDLVFDTNDCNVTYSNNEDEE